MQKHHLNLSGGVLYPSYFKLQVCWLRSLTRITNLSKLIGIHSLAAFLQLELFWVYLALRTLHSTNQTIFLTLINQHSYG
ncbi:hypothetical protein W909_19475 [Dickeya zeae EC1]|nr:hypothetical protein W909_19475 [Dickeya zeae EC1]